ncbi:MAG: zinc ribbon domain-containing protein [Thermoleophilia bacterium]
MANTCYNCGTENAESEKFCHSCGAALGRLSDLQHSAIQGGRGPERVLWDNGEVQLTTEAVLIGMTGDAPDVVPLETIYDVVLEERCVVLKVKDGDDKYCMLADPTELAGLIKDHMFRPRLAHERKDMGYIPPD